MRSQLDDTEAGRVRLEEEIPERIDAMRQEADVARVAQVAALEAQAAEQRDAARRDAEAAVGAQETKLAAQAAVLTGVRAELDDTEARRMQLEEDLPVRLDVVRQELAAAHAVEVAALQTRGAAQVAAAVRDEQTEAAQMLVETVQRSERSSGTPKRGACSWKRTSRCASTRHARS